MRRLVLGLLLALAVGAPASAIRWDPLPPRPGWILAPPPDLSAPAYILFDDQSDWVVAARNEDAQRAPASTTKIMTALVVADFAAFDEMVTISVTAPEAGESEIGIVSGEVITVADLLKALLVRSANDAAVALAEHVGGSVEGFSSLMNEKAAALGMTNSHFVNPHGLDEEGHYTSAADELIMSRALLDNPQLASIVVLNGIDFPAAADGTQRGGPATNQLLEDYQGLLGIKTGYTLDASLVLAAAAEREGRRLFAVVMGSEGASGHFVDAEELLDFGFEKARIPTTVSTIDPNGPLAQAAKGEALAWLGLSDLLVAPPIPPPIEVRVTRTPESPDWRQALGWVDRFWGALRAEMFADGT